MLGDVALDVARRSSGRAGETLTLPLLASQPTTARSTRLWVSARRRPVAQASYSASALGQRLHLAQRAAQVGVGLVEVLAVLRVLLGDASAPA